MKLTRAKLEELVEDLIEKTRRALQAGAEGRGPEGRRDQRGDPGRRHDPHAQGAVEAVKQFFGKEPHKGVNPDEVVAIGAAIQGACWTAR